MTGHPAPIGVFDSGLGGLSVALELRHLLPAERLLYAADNAFCPYGSRPAEEIRWRSLLMTNELVERGAKLLVVACNTACAVALEEMRERLPVPIVGMEPAVKPALAHTKTGKLAVLATPRTAGSDRLRRLIERYGRGYEVFPVPAPGLVELVEGGEMEGEAVEGLLADLLGPPLAAGVDTVVLGCTHYPFLRPATERVVGPGVAVIDSGAAIARRTRDILHERAMEQRNPGAGGLRLLTTGDPVAVAAVAGRLVGHPVAVERFRPAAQPVASGHAGWDPLPAKAAACTGVDAGGA